MNKYYLLALLFPISMIGYSQNNWAAGTGAGNAGINNSSFGVIAGDLVTGGDNSFFGFRAGTATKEGNNNSFFGSSSGMSNLASNNSFFGYYSGGNTGSGANNSFFGFYSGQANTSGFQNVFIGSAAGARNTTGANNVYIGEGSGVYNLTGTRNSCVGQGSGNQMTASDNTLIGYWSGRYLTTGGANTFLGSLAGQNITTGTSNVYLGYGTGLAGLTVTNNTYVGTSAGGNSAGSNNVFIGNNAGLFENGSGKLYISNSSTSTPLVYGDFSAHQLAVNTVVSGTNTLSVGGSIYSSGNVSLDNVAPAIYLGTGSIDLNRYLTVLNSSATPQPSGLKAGGLLVADTYAYANPSKNDLIVKGNVSIGTPFTNKTNGYLLAVNGKVGAKDIQIERTSNAWPDYVFKRSYKLPSLYEVERYIEKNKHLEDVPSSEEVQEKGFSVNEMNEVLLKKVEELTLYVIQQQKEIDALKKKMR